MSGGGIMAECVATPCYVERIAVASCRPVSEVLVESDGLAQLGLKPKEADALLKATPGVVLLGKIQTSRPLSRCGEPDEQRLANGPVVKEYLALDVSCENFPIGVPQEGFVSTTCCDTLPVESAECVLLLETFGSVPGWAKQDQSDSESP